MLKSGLNKEVVVTYEVGYSYGNKKGVITKIDSNFILLGEDTLIAVKNIVKVVIKGKKNANKST